MVSSFFGPVLAAACATAIKSWGGRRSMSCLSNRTRSIVSSFWKWDGQEGNSVCKSVRPGICSVTARWSWCTLEMVGKGLDQWVVKKLVSLGEMWFARRGEWLRGELDEWDGRWERGEGREVQSERIRGWLCFWEKHEWHKNWWRITWERRCRCHMCGGWLLNALSKKGAMQVGRWKIGSDMI